MSLDATALKNRTVVTVDGAASLGRVEDVMFDTDQLRVAALSLNLDGAHSVLPFAAVQSVGAEAITVNNHRLGGHSWIRCVGSVMHVDGIPVSSPIRVCAIGDSETLVGALNIPLGVLSELRSVDPAMVSVETVKKMRLPAYTGSTAYRIAKVPKDKQ